MQVVQVFNVSKNVIIARQAWLATTLRQRMQGLLGKRSLLPEEALVLKPCTCIHTFLMRFSIDVLFVDKDMRVISLIPNMPPNRLSPLVWRSQMVIELPPGKISQTNTQPGDILEIIKRGSAIF